jgi:hypothetical protein
MESGGYEGHYVDIGKRVLRLLQALSYLTCESMMQVNDKLRNSYMSHAAT